MAPGYGPFQPMPMMQNDDFETLAALDALGALEEAESRDYAELTRSATSEMLAAAASLREAAAFVGLIAEPVDPPAGLRTAILQAIGSTPQKRTIRAVEQPWQPHPVPGVEYRELSSDDRRGTATILLRVAADASFPPHEHHGAEDCYVLEGTVRIGSVALAAGDFHHAPAGTNHGTLHTETGCTLLLIVDKHDYAIA